MEQDKVLDAVIAGINYSFEKDILIKPLPAIMVKKEYTEQIPTGKTDKEGFNEYTTKTHTKEVESDLAEGIVLCLPIGYEGNVQVGNTIVYPKKFAKDFDLFKNSQLIKSYDVIAIKH